MTEEFNKAISLIKFDVDIMRDTEDYDRFFDLLWTIDSEMSVALCFARYDDEFQAIRDLEHERIKVFSERYDDLREESLEKSREHEREMQELENEIAKKEEEIDDLNLKIEKLEDDNYARAEVIANARLDGAIQ